MLNNQNKKAYEPPAVEIIRFAHQDVITSSGGLTDGGAGFGEEAEWVEGVIPQVIPPVIPAYGGDNIE